MAKRIRYAFADSGDKTTVNDEVQSDGVVSYEQGYGAQYSADITSDPTARRINRDRFNQIMNDVTSNTKEWQEQLYPDWIDPSVNGGVNYSYKQGMIVTDTNGDYKISLVDNNSDDTTTSNWDDAWPIPIVLGGTGATTVSGARANLNLGTAAERNVGITSGTDIPDRALADARYLPNLTTLASGSLGPGTITYSDVSSYTHVTIYVEFIVGPAAQTGLTPVTISVEEFLSGSDINTHTATTPGTGPEFSRGMLSNITSTSATWTVNENSWSVQISKIEGYI